MSASADARTGERVPPTVELIFFHGCPNADLARVHVEAALRAAGSPAACTEWDLRSPDLPDRLRGHGSSTVLVAGRDVIGGAAPESPRDAAALACRADGGALDRGHSPGTASHLNGKRDSALAHARRRLTKMIESRRRIGSLMIALVILAAGPGCGSDDGQPANTVSGDDASIDRGRYLVEGLLQCFVCHSERDWEAPGGPPVEGRAGAGRVRSDDGQYRLVAPNLTPDAETGTGNWTDDQLARAIREGMGHNGRILSPRMWYRSFRHLPDDDLQAVIAYLRSIDPVYNPLPTTVLPPDYQAELNERGPAELKPVNLASADLAEVGRGLVALADCEGCHTAWEAPEDGPLLAGGNPIERDGRRAFSTNITPDASGMPYDAATFIEVIRTGKQSGLHPLMPWIAFRNLSDRDLRAIHAYLQTMPPVAHFINNHAEPGYCAVCGQMHGLGEMNSAWQPAGIVLDADAYDRYVGTYYSEEDDFRFEITVADGRLMARIDDDDPVVMTFISQTRIVVPGEATALDFVFVDGRVARLLTVESSPVVLERIE